MENMQFLNSCFNEIIDEVCFSVAPTLKNKWGKTDVHFIMKEVSVFVIFLWLFDF